MRFTGCLLPLAIVAAVVVNEAGAAPLRLPAVERAQGWRLLFDGESLSDWRGFRARKLPANWQVSGGALLGTPGSALVTAEDFRDFELQFEWKVEAGGRGEVYFHVAEEGAGPEDTGLVMELAGHGEALGGTGGLLPATGLVKSQYDVWFSARIVVYGDLVEYWVNGQQVCRYTIGSPDWKAALAASGRPVARDFGRLGVGRIALAGDGVHFRAIKLKAL